MHTTTALLVATFVAWLALSAPHAANAQQVADAVLVPATASGLSPDDCFPIPATSKACPNFRGALVHPNLAAFLASAVFQTRSTDGSAAFAPGTVPYALELPAPSAVVGTGNGSGFDQAFNISVIANAPAIWRSLLGCALQWPAALAPPSTISSSAPAVPTAPAIGDAWSMTAPSSTLRRRDAPDSLAGRTPSPVYHTTVMCALLVQYWRPLCGASTPTPPQLCPATSRAYAASLSAVAPPPTCAVAGLASLVNSTAPIAPKTPLTANYGDGLAKVFAWLAAVTAPTGAPCLAGETAEPMCGLPRNAACALGCASPACSAAGGSVGGGSAAPKAGTDAPATSAATAASGSSGTVVAASVGGVAVLLAAVAGTFFLVRRRRRQRDGREGKRRSPAALDELEIGSASLARRATHASHHVHVALHAPTASSVPFADHGHGQTADPIPPRTSARTTASEPDASAATDTDSSAAVRAAMTHAADHLARPRVWPTPPRAAAIKEEAPPTIARTLPREDVPDTAAAQAEIPVKFRAYVGVPLVADASFMRRLPDEIDVMCGDTVVLDWAWEDAWAQGTNLTTGHDGTFPLAVISTIA
ncbi:hypothetical protein GGF32_009976, partial [Allomyces javanicus]